MTYLNLKSKKLNITGQFVKWDKNDPGYKMYLGSVHFENHLGFLCHDGSLMLGLADNNLKRMKRYSKDMIAILENSNLNN